MTIKFIREATTYAEVLSRASSFLKQKHKEPQIAEWLMKERFNLTLTNLVMHQKQEMNETDKEIFINDVTEASQGKPPQHIVGHEWFYDRQFKITEATLIPRPETEEWFDRYIKHLPERPLRVIDLGTGSGVLAISHKLERPQDEVVGVDISQAALTVASSNARTLGAEVTFIESDMLAKVTGTFDLILSNPPYISQSERNEMDESVIDFEPHLALFAEEEGLYFYKKIAVESSGRLNPEGEMILEFGYKQAAAIKTIFGNHFPDAAIKIEKDFNNNDRTIHLKWDTKIMKEGVVNADSLS
ncbi:peptide chain release factor N(5)-glutamine methyltransferase [Alkalibacterium sp. 20]|uniref:peptide chain release factor N(5)-glutamine methyltransferase n=1 Tax=Alkalibacterium sp. 20 TaxID=1798803 RepID=UPI0009003D75|nr:peptide chain release factor N(5)-glutamine methyltransferase [Alkalibacterium sp. 20]OJF91576.1 hypothetical protein AX762_03415 [Alkalibacterium sp. 20]